jgi:hypothetical protein
MYKPGDPVIYLAPKHSSHPGPRAEDLAPEPSGEGYSYTVKKFWTVLAARDDGRLALMTRRGKTRIVEKCDPNLRPANWWERLFFANRFPQLSGKSGSRSMQAQAG